MTELGSDSCSNCGWVDYVQSPMPSDWNSVGYVYDPSGRRIEKRYDGQAVMKYLYDGDSILVEYDATGALVHKYIYGPGVDQPICMIDVSDANATYYYHFDGLGSVIALTDSAGAVANLYEYSIFGEVSASDPNHPNRFLFTGREFDSETGLYYYRARYYNPYIGRFLQTDPIGYEGALNLYQYCLNNPIIYLDPFGLDYWSRPPSAGPNEVNGPNDSNDYNTPSVPPAPPAPPAPPIEPAFESSCGSKDKIAKDYSTCTTNAGNEKSWCMFRGGCYCGGVGVGTGSWLKRILPRRIRRWGPWGLGGFCMGLYTAACNNAWQNQVNYCGKMNDWCLKGGDKSGEEKPNPPGWGPTEKDPWPD